MSYTTGEIAQLCGVTVRAVQFYDREGLLTPDDYSEGGRRLYGEEGLKRLQIICSYKSLGFSLAEIKSVLSDESGSKKLLLLLLDAREKALGEEIKDKLAQRDALKLFRRSLSEGSPVDPNIFIDVRKVMEGKKKLKVTYAVMGIGAALCLAAEIAASVLWAVKGWWIPFAVILPLIFVFLSALTVVYYKNTAYICKECGKKFKPKFLKVFFAPHTPKTRRLVCPHCGCKAYHIETYSD